LPTSLRKPRPRINPALGTVLLLLALNLLNYLDRYILNGAQPLVQGEFHATDQQMGALTTAFFLTYMIFAPLSGWLGDWYRRKPLIIIGAIIWSLATLGTALVHTYATFYVSRALVGIGEATFGIYAPAILADFYPDRDRNRILSIFYLAIPVGAALGYLAGGELGSLWGWRAPYLICAVPGLLIAALYGGWGREPERGGKDRLRPVPKRADSWDALERIVKRRLRLFTMGSFLTAIGLALITFTFGSVRFARPRLRIFKNPAFLTSTFGLATITFALGGISAWVPTFLHRANGLSVANASLVVGAITVVDGIGGTIVGGWIAHRWQRTDHRALYLISFWSVVLTIPFGFLIFFGPHSTTIPALVLAEFFIFLNNGPINAAIVNSVPGAVRATAISINLFCIHFFGDTFSPQIIGAISDRSTLSIGLGATLVSLFIACGILWYGARFATPYFEAQLP
jgi:MFS transporter, Spinster family, sphingosine-1-phosphate transporter